jgi:hypothetical protein
VGIIIRYILDIFSLDIFSLEFRLIGVSLLKIISPFQKFKYSDLRSLERKINFLPISCFSSIPFLMKIFNISISNVLPVLNDKALKDYGSSSQPPSSSL